MVYVGQTRSRALIATLMAMGFGETTCRGELPPRRRPWFYDNGAFTDWRAGRSFDAEEFRVDVARIAASAHKPAFMIVPDIVGGGWKSLDFSLGWLDELRGVAPLYLAVQDGMDEAIIADFVDRFQGLFVGGTLAWKVRSGHRWVSFAHGVGMPCHIGRVGTFHRVRWAKRIGADSIDSSLPLWSRDNLKRFMDGLADDGQLTLTPTEPTAGSTS